MTPITDLPVWTIAPNWANGIRETLTWLTDVMKGDNGVEQRRSLRLTPRRAFEFDFLLTGPRRTFLDLIATKLSTQEWMVPLWHDQSAVSSAAASGQATIAVDTTYREFRVGDYAVLMGPDIWTYERVQINTINADNIVVEDNLASTWPVGTKLYPLRRMAMYGDVTIKALTSRVGESSIGFECNQENGFDSGAYAGLSYNTLPVLTVAPDYKIQPETTYERLMQTSDSQTGLKYFLDQAERAHPNQNHSYLLVGRQERFEFRQYLYRMKGMTMPAWLPSYNDDIVLSADASIGDGALDIDKIGYAFAGGVATGRKFILLNGASGYEIVEVTSTAAAPSSVEERLNLSAVLTKDFYDGDTGSFLETGRLAQDRVEILHHTDADGVAECRLSYKSFPDVRDASGTIYQPVHTAEMSEGGCSEPDVATCTYILPPAYEGWDHEWTFEVQDPGGGTPSLSFLLIDYPGSGGIHDWNDPTGPTRSIFSRTTTGGGGQPWIQKWKMNRSFPIGTYTVTWDPQNFPGTQTYIVSIRKYTDLVATEVDRRTTGSSAPQNRSFISGDT